MEDESVAQDIDLDQQTVADRVSKLNQLFDDMRDTYRPRLQQANDLQSSATWTSIAATAEYRAALRGTLDDAETRLRVLWTKVQGLCTTLQQNAADLTDLDQATRDSLTQLLQRASEPMPEPAMPHRALPGSARPDVDVPSTSPSPSPSPSPAPAPTSAPAPVWDGSGATS